MTERAMRGLYIAPAQPMTAALAPDRPAWLDHCRALLALGADGLMPIGSTGEAHSLTVAERIGLMDALAGSGLPMARMMIGTSALALPDAAALVRHAVALGAGRVCVQPAFYYKPFDDDALYAWFANLIERVGDGRLRLLIYDWEGNLGIAFSDAVLARLFADFPEQVRGIKDSSGKPELIAHRARIFPDRDVFAGVDSTGLACLRAGGAGILSSLGNVIAPTLVALCRDFAGADGDRLQGDIDALLQAMAGLPYFAAVKDMLAEATGRPAWRHARPPIVPLNPGQREVLAARLSALATRPTAA